MINWRLHPMRGALLTTALFAIAAVALLAARPLWLDEILQLIETREPSAARMVANIPRNPGAAPLGYLAQHASLSLTGYSVRKARLPAAAFGIATVFAVGLLGAELGLTHAWISAALFALMPMVLRYATESRVYSQALFLTVLATIVYVRLGKRPTWPMAAAYFAVLSAAVYTQPYAAAAGIAHVLWSATGRERRTALLGGAALAASVVAFVPWYLWSKARWTATVAESSLHFSASAKTPLMVFRELAGGGYWGSGVLLILCALAVTRRRLDKRARALLLMMIAVPLVCVFTGDALGDYFIASRQFMWVLPGLAILAAAEVEAHSRTGVAFAALLAAICVWQDFRYFTTARENWGAAAAAIGKETAKGACLTVAPPDSAIYYEFFRPELSDSICQARRMVLAVTPYTSNQQRAAAIGLLIAQGYKQDHQSAAGGSTLLIFRR